MIVKIKLVTVLLVFLSTAAYAEIGSLHENFRLESGELIKFLSPKVDQNFILDGQPALILDLFIMSENKNAITADILVQNKVACSGVSSTTIVLPQEGDFKVEIRAEGYQTQFFGLKYFVKAQRRQFFGIKMLEN